VAGREGRLHRAGEPPRWFFGFSHSPIRLKCYATTAVHKHIYQWCLLAGAFFGGGESHSCPMSTPTTFVLVQQRGHLLNIHPLPQIQNTHTHLTVKRVPGSRLRAERERRSWEQTIASRPVPLPCFGSCETGSRTGARRFTCWSNMGHLTFLN